MTKAEIESIVQSIGKNFRCFGKGSTVQEGNPIAHWLADSPLQFALGVDVRAVVEHVVKVVERSRRARLRRRKRVAQ